MFKKRTKQGQRKRPLLGSTTLLRRTAAAADDDDDDGPLITKATAAAEFGGNDNVDEESDRAVDQKKIDDDDGDGADGDDRNAKTVVVSSLLQSTKLRQAAQQRKATSSSRTRRMMKVVPPRGGAAVASTTTATTATTTTTAVLENNNIEQETTLNDDETSTFADHPHGETKEHPKTKKRSKKEKKVKRDHTKRRIHPDGIGAAITEEKEQQEQIDQSGSRSSLYSKQALAQLKAEQQKAPPPVPLATTTTTTTLNDGRFIAFRNDDDAPPSTIGSTVAATAVAATGSNQVEGCEQRPKIENDDFISLPPRQRKNKKNLRTTEPSERKADGGDDDDDDDNNPTILAGDEAFLGVDDPDDGAKIMHDNDDDAMLPENSFDARTAHTAAGVDDEEEEDAAWHDQLSRRAQWGAAVTPIVDPGRTDGLPIHHKPEKRKSSPSLSQFQQHVAMTLEMIQSQRNSMQEQMERRRQQMDDAATSMLQHAATVREVGETLEWYQKWRIRLCESLVVIRSLQSSLRAISSAHASLHEDVANVAMWTNTWQDDLAQCLHDYHALDQVVGRLVDVVVATTTTTTNVDEFGRTIQSQQSLQRERRAKRRDRIEQQYQQKQQRPQRYRHDHDAMELWNNDDDNNDTTIPLLILHGDESDALWSDDEAESLRHRRAALREAVAFAMTASTSSSLSSDQSSSSEGAVMLQNLFDLFREWHDAHPAEYQQCYASLSLADLAAVLVTADVILYFVHDDDCGGNKDNKAKNERRQHMTKWTQVVRAALEHQYMDAAAVDRLIEKSVLPILNDLLSLSWSDKSGPKSSRLNLISRRQVVAVGSLVRHVFELLPDPGKSAVRGRMLDMVRQFAIDALDNVAVPIATQAPPGLSSSLLSPSSSLSPLHTAEQQRARCMYDASFGQLRRMRKVVTNLVTLWGPFLKTDAAFATAILDFVANRFLFVLSSSMMVGNSGHDGKVGNSVHGDNDRRVDDFAAIYQGLRDTTDWLDDPDLMLPAAPIAGAALAYRVG